MWRDSIRSEDEGSGLSESDKVKLECLSGFDRVKFVFVESVSL